MAFYRNEVKPQVFRFRMQRWIHCGLLQRTKRGGAHSDSKFYCLQNKRVILFESDQFCGQYLQNVGFSTFRLLRKHDITKKEICF